MRVISCILKKKTFAHVIIPIFLFIDTKYDQVTFGLLRKKKLKKLDKHTRAKIFESTFPKKLLYNNSNSKYE